MKGKRVYDLKLTNTEQREEIIRLEKVIDNLKRQDIETRLSFYEILQKLSNTGHSTDRYKIIHMTDIIDNAIEEMWEDLKIDLFVEDNKKGKIIELPTTDQSDR